MPLFYINQTTLAPDMKKLGDYIRKQDKVLEVTVKDAKRIKSVAQNAYYHHLVGSICKESGENFEDLRFRMKIELGYYEEIWVKGEPCKRVKSLSKVSIEQSNKFIDSAIGMCNFLNIIMPSRESFYEDINYYG